MKKTTLKPTVAILEIPPDQWGMALFFFTLNSDSRDDRIVAQAIGLLAPRFDADQFHGLAQRLGLGEKFTLRQAELLLARRCRDGALILVIKGSLKKAAIYRVARPPPRSR